MSNTQDNLLALVKAQLDNPQWCFRTIAGIARDTGLSEPQIQEAITMLGTAVRIPIVPDPQGRQLYTAADRRPRWRERWMYWRYLIAR